jgi:hypothetical protein
MRATNVPKIRKLLKLLRCLVGFLILAQLIVAARHQAKPLPEALGNLEVAGAQA